MKPGFALNVGALLRRHAVIVGKNGIGFVSAAFLAGHGFLSGNRTAVRLL